MQFWPVVLLAGIIAVLFSAWLARDVLSQDRGTKAMQEVAGLIFEGAMAFLNRQYRTISVIAVQANLRTAAAAQRSVKAAINVSLRGGAVSGFLVVALSLLGVLGIYAAFGGFNAAPIGATAAQRLVDGVSSVPFEIVGFGFGASFVALFAQLGGGIYTKAADVGADLVGKIEAGIPEDDPRNPAVIADNVGDNVGDCAGMAADLFETYAVTAIAAMLLGSLLFPGKVQYVLYPLILGAISIIATVIGTSFVRLGRSTWIM